MRKSHGDNADEVFSKDRPDVEVLVREKAGRLADYRRGSDAVILVIVADRSRDSGMLHLEDDGVPRSNHGFDEVYWHEHPLRTIRLV